MDDLTTLKHLARQFVRYGTRPIGALTHAQFIRATTRAKLREIPEAIWQAIETELDHNPRFGVALARVTNAVAARRRNPRVRARADLALIRALNVTGAFREAVDRCRDAAERFERLNDGQGMALVLLQAAWAETYLGHLERAHEYLERARATCSEDKEVKLRSDWIGARILREQGKFQQASSGFEQLGSQLDQVNPIVRAQVLCEIGHTLTPTNPTDALLRLEQARQTFQAANCPTEMAHCDYFKGQAYIDLNRYEEAKVALRVAHEIFRAHNMRFFEALCDLEWGFLLCELDQFQESLEYSTRARAALVELDAQQEVSSCEVNMGWALLQLNRYAEALPYFESAATSALESGRQGKAAVCFLNMGEAHQKQGHFAQAIQELKRAYEIFDQRRMTERLVECNLKLGQLYYQLGDYTAALATLEDARDVSRAAGLSARLGECELYRAHVFLLSGKTPAARQALQTARELFAQNQQRVFAALCERLYAQIEFKDKPAALARLEASRHLFDAQGLVVDAALCDLIRAEVELKWGEWDAAQQSLRKVQRVLQCSFPDYGWRIQYDLGKATEGQNRPGDARRHYRQAARLLANLRGDLRAESLSDNFFGARQYALDDALRFMQHSRWDKDTLSLIETAKAQTFIHQLALREWRTADQARPEVHELLGREQALRQELAQRRAVLSPPISSTPRVLPSRGERGQRAAGIVAELSELEHTYEEVVTRLRLAQRGLAGAPTLEPFRLARFREMAERRWGQDWAALEYYFVRGRLYTVYVNSSARVQVFTPKWSSRDQFILEQCASSHADLYELIYQGTVRGVPVPSEGNQYLQYLAARLVPPEVLASRRELTVVISPHGLLHRLPFHALLQEGKPLVDRLTFLYTPNLQALTQLEPSEPSKHPPRRQLLCGLRYFDGRAFPLEHTLTEIQALESLAANRCTVQWQEQATRSRLLAWNSDQKLKRFDALHFATHTVIEPRSPHSSRILLGEGDLTVLDVMELNLEARLVTLSACSSAQGQVGRGDEVQGLTRAFFYAGARALVASLWAVNDESTAQLMVYFYQNLAAGQSIARALRQAQLTLRAQGYTAFHWAPFIAMGAA